MNGLRRMLLLWLCLLAAPALQAVEITVAPDRTEVAVDESFELVFRARGEPDDGPDFSPLEADFEILTQSQSHSLRILGGSSDREREWSLTLMPRRAGSLQIPSIAFGSDRSPALELEVRPARQRGPGEDEDIFMEAVIDTNQTWVQAQVVLTIRIFHAPELRSGRLQTPRLDDAEAVIEGLGEDRSYHTQRGGRRYFVIERRYVVFPQSAGQHQIEPILFQGQLLLPAGRFDPFQQRTRTVRLQTQALPLEVRPIPAQFQGRPWLPARSLQLAEHWSSDPPRLRQGEPTTRTLALIADGLLASQLPELVAPLPDSLRQYPDQPRLETQRKDSGVIGLREEKHAIIANQPGTVLLPGFDLLWFNTTTGQAETAQLPPRQLQVSAAAGLTPPPPRVDSPAQGAAPAAPVAPTAGAAGYWPWLTALFGAGWLATLTAWLWSAHGRAPAGPAAATPPGRGAALKRLRQACAATDARAAEAALLDWAGTVWPESPPRSLGALARRLGPPQDLAVRALEACRYATGPHDWQPDRLYDALSHWRDSADGQARTDSGLPRLHPNLG